MRRSKKEQLQRQAIVKEDTLREQNHLASRIKRLEADLKLMTEHTSVKSTHRPKRA